MHKLINYICDELEELERKADKDGKLSMAEVQYMDTLAHAKKNLLKGEEMMESEYSNADEGMYPGSYARSGNRNSYGGRSYPRSYARRRDAMGRYSSCGYSRAGDDMVMELRELMENAPDERTRQEFQHFISKIEQM